MLGICELKVEKLTGVIEYYSAFGYNWVSHMALLFIYFLRGKDEG